ncbi:MAG: flagellar biosynthesis protein FlhF [Deltaproteobacteria bacterium]|nr:flagellar biosynthesis protein FlhF [Deltaproteobacteria bacterium]
MQIKRFEAENMTKALRLVKQEFGSEAVILSARSLEKKKGVFWPMKRPVVEVTAAKDTSYPETEKTSSDKIRKFENLSNEKSLISPLRGGIKVLKDKPDNIVQNYDRKLADLNQQMLSQGVEKNIARKLTEQVKRIASSKKFLKDEELKLCLIRILKEMGITARPVKIETGKQKVVAFIGPTGVGKTITIAKLAVIHAIKMRKRVALITLDNYRIGGIDQLKIYAKIIGIPFEVASTGKEFKECLNRLKDKELILIDTAGMSQRDESRFNELRALFDKIRHVETHLLLSATTKENDLINILAMFKAFPVSKLLFTKLDESTSYGNMFNQLIRSKIPVSYFTNGQEIPEDIEIATLEKMVDLITNREKDGKHSGEAYVASKNSIFFHCFDCQLVKRIKQENIIVFERAIDAVNKQFKPCKSCCPDKVEKQSLCSWDADTRKNGTY